MNDIERKGMVHEPAAKLHCTWGSGRVLPAIAFGLAVWASSAAAQECDPARGVIFSFDGSTPFVTATVKNLVPRTVLARSFRGTGTMQFDDGSLLPLLVTVKARGTKLTYTMSGRSATSRVRGSVVSEDCLLGIAKMRFSASGPLFRTSIRDLSLIGVAGIMTRGVVARDATDIGELAIDATDRMTLTTPSADPVVPSLAAGTIIIASNTASTPNGLLRKVTAVTVGTDTTTIATEMATLDDAFESFDVEMGPDPDDASAAAATTRMASAGTRAWTGPRIAFDHTWSNPEGEFAQRFARIGFEKTIEIDWSKDASLSLASGAVKVGGSVDLASQLSFGVHTGWKYVVVPTLKSMHADLDGRLNAMVYATASQSVSASKHWSGPEFNLGEIQVGPLSIFPKLQLVGGIDGSFAASTSAKVTTGFTFGTGFHCQGFDCTPRGDFTWLAPQGDLKASAVAQFRPYFGAELELAVEDIFGPYIRPELYLQTKVQSSYPEWVLKGGLEVDVGFDFDFLSLHKSWDAQAFAFEREIDRAPSPTTTTTLPGNPSANNWCGHSASTGFGPIEQCYKATTFGLYLVNYSPLNGDITTKLGPLALKTSATYSLDVTSTDDPNTHRFYGGPKVTGGFGDVSYGEQRWVAPVYGPLLRWGNYSFVDHKFHPGGDWMADVE